MLDDVETATRFAAELAGTDLPTCGKQAGRVHLVGVSWGGKLATAYALRARLNPRVVSLTLIAPGIVPRVDISFTTKLAVGVALLLNPRRRFDLPLNDPALFIDNEQMRQYLRCDSARLHRATARFLYITDRLGRTLRTARTGSLELPTTLILATRDKIIDNARTRSLISRLCGEHLEVKHLPGAHTLEFEEDPEPFYQVLVDALARGE